MNIRDALLKAMEIKGVAVRGEERLVPFMGHMGTMAGGGWYHDFHRWFMGNSTQSIIGYDSLVADDWEVENRGIFTHGTSMRYPIIAYPKGMEYLALLNEYVMDKIIEAKQ